MHAGHVCFRIWLLFASVTPLNPHLKDNANEGQFILGKYESQQRINDFWKIGCD